MQKGKIIFLNGVSCSGKTTLAKALQERLTEPFYSLGLDTFINMSPVRYFSDPDGRTIVNKAVSILSHTIKTFSDMGLNTIIDHVFMKIDNLLDDCVELLHEYPVLFVHVTCPLEEHLRRAKERGINPEVIKWQIPLLIPQDTYDLTIDTTNEECVDKIVELLYYPEQFTAFRTLWSQRIL
jgi:chloramphenicol 3-O phosphotransferase